MAGLVISATAGLVLARNIDQPWAMGGIMIADHLRRFLHGRVPSVPHLEALLLLHADPATRWNVPQLAGRLYVDEARAARVLDDLAASGLLQPEPAGYRFAPREPSLATVVTELATVYARHVIAVTELIHSTSERKATLFADAFRFRKDS